MQKYEGFIKRIKEYSSHMQDEHIKEMYDDDARVVEALIQTREKAYSDRDQLKLSSQYWKRRFDELKKDLEEISEVKNENKNTGSVCMDRE